MSTIASQLTIAGTRTSGQSVRTQNGKKNWHFIIHALPKK
jgi:hypothetical protein